jgi:hypothetical protein
MHKLVAKLVLSAALLAVIGQASSAYAQTPSRRLIFGPDYESSGQVPRDPAAYEEGLKKADELRKIPLVDAADKAVIGSAEAAKNLAESVGGTLIDWIGTKTINFIIYWLSYYAGVIGSTLFTLAGLLVEFGLFLNTTILDSEVVQLGWRFCRDLANLGFTIGIVVIAYATMLGIESYGMKQLIKNFVVAAVLVNFSFSIAGAMIDGSNLLTNFFVSASIGGGPSGSAENIRKFGDTLAGTFGPQRLLVTDNEGKLEKFRTESNGGMWAATLSIFFVALFTVFCALGMLAVGITTFWRFAHLSGLIIIMPLAILASSFPDTKGQWEKWKKKFLCQLTYLPTATFSLYLVIMFVQIKASVGLAAGQINAIDLIDSFEKSAAAGDGVSSTLALMARPFQVITDMVIVLTMVFMGIIESRKVGCAAGDFAIKWMEGVRGWAIGAVKGAPGWAGRKYLSGGGTKPTETRGARLANFMSALPLVRRLVPRLNNFTAKTKQNIGNFETEYKGLGDEQLLKNLRSLEIRTNAERMAAAAKVAAERKLFSETDKTKGLSQEEFAAFAPALKRYGMDGDVLKKLPYLYGKFGLDLSKDEDKKKFDGYMKEFKPEDIENMPEEAFADPEIVSRLNSAHFEKLPKKDTYRAAFATTITEKLPGIMGEEKFGEFIAKVFSKPEAETALLPKLLENRLVVKSLPSASIKTLSGSDKAEHRKAFLKTINDPTFSDKEFGDFMRDNFAKGKDIDGIHPDILRNPRFFAGLNEKHIERMNAEPDENQQEAMLASLRAAYKKENEKTYAPGETPAEDTLAKLDRMAKVIIEKKNDWQWSPLAGGDRSKEDFAQVEASYRMRNPDETPQKQTQQKKTPPPDPDSYGPSAPTPPPNNPPYPGGGGGPSVGGIPPKQPPATGGPTSIPKSPYPVGGGPSVSANGQSNPFAAKTPPKASDMANAMDAAIKNTNLYPSNIEPKDDFSPPAQPIAPSNPNNTKSQPASTVDVRPITPSELDILARAEQIRINEKETLIAPQKSTVIPNTKEKIILEQSKVEGKGWQPPKPIDAEFEIKKMPLIENKAGEPRGIPYQGPLTPPQEPPLPKPPRAEDNELSVIPKSEIAKINPNNDQERGTNNL